MISVDVLDFCEDNAISIAKFLQDNFSIKSYIPKFNVKKKKWRIKHNEISGWINVIPVSLKFAYRYKHLVLTGKLVIVQDDFGKFCVYINPRIIQESFQLKELQILLQELDANDLEFYENAIKIAEFKRQLVGKIQDIEENIRIIKHFNGDDSLEYTMNIMNLLDEPDNNVRKRKIVEKK